MIPFDFAYLRPASLEEAFALRAEFPRGALWYGGGTEIVTGAREGSNDFEALIDVKDLPELRLLGPGGAGLYFGAALPLTALAEQRLFPLLAAAVRGVADRTVRNRLSLGGNLCGRLPWREALLPFLAADGLAHLASPAEGGGFTRRELPVRELQDKRLKLGPGELLLGLSVADTAAAAPWRHDRRTAGARVDYPLLSLCAVKTSPGLAVAASGAFDYPSWAEGPSPGPGDFPTRRADQRGSAEYREALLAAALETVKKELA